MRFFAGDSIYSGRTQPSAPCIFDARGRVTPFLSPVSCRLRHAEVSILHLRPGAISAMARALFRLLRPLYKFLQQSKLDPGDPQYAKTEFYVTRHLKAGTAGRERDVAPNSFYPQEVLASHVESLCWFWSFPNPGN